MFKFCKIGNHVINLAAITHVDSLKGSISVCFYGSETMRLRRPESDEILAVLGEFCEPRRPTSSGQQSSSVPRQ